MALDRQRQLVGGQALAVVGDQDAGQAAAVGLHLDRGARRRRAAFSTSSLTALAGRSTTSPAAMRLTVSGGRRRMGMDTV